MKRHFSPSQLVWGPILNFCGPFLIKVDYNEGNSKGFPSQQRSIMSLKEAFLKTHRQTTTRDKDKLWRKDTTGDECSPRVGIYDLR